MNIRFTIAAVVALSSLLLVPQVRAEVSALAQRNDFYGMPIVGLTPPMALAHIATCFSKRALCAGQ